MLVAAIEDRARERGITRLRLETRPQLHRRRGALPVGFVEIPAYGEYVGNPISYCMSASCSVPGPR